MGTGKEFYGHGHAFPENIERSSRWHEIPNGRGFEKALFLKRCVKANYCNFQRVQRGKGLRLGFQPKNLHWKGLKSLHFEMHHTIKHSTKRPKWWIVENLETHYEEWQVWVRIQELCWIVFPLSEDLCWPGEGESDMTGSWMGHNAEKQMTHWDDGCMTDCTLTHVFPGFPWQPLSSTFLEVFATDHSLWDVL